MYYRSPRHKRVGSYFKPFVIIAIIFGIVFFGWQSIKNYFVSQNQNTFSEKVFLDIESGSAKAMTVGKKEWQNAPDKINLYRGEKIKTGSDGRVTLSYFNGSEARLNTNSEMAFKTLKKKNETYEIESLLTDGNVWAKVERINNPDSSFSISTPLVKVATRSASFAIEYPGTVYVIEGNTQVDIRDGNSTVKTYSVGVGQQLSIDEKGVESVRKGEDIEVIFALNDTFKKTNWYKWNLKKNNNEELTSEDLAIDESSEEKTSETEVDTDETSNNEDNATEEEIGSEEVLIIRKPSNNTATNQRQINLEGSFKTSKVATITANQSKANLSDDGKWSVQINLSEGKNTIEVKAANKEGETIETKALIINYDITSPNAPVITSPKLNDDNTYELEEAEQTIEGTVDQDVQAVIVNDYRLTQYVPGSKSFKYFAKVEYGNLKAGENEFKIYAEDKAGNLSSVTTITLILPPEILEEINEASAEKSDNTSEPVLAEAKSSGGVRFTEPNNGESFHTTETEFELKGEVPQSTAKVTVNDYQLSKFKEGDNSFSYKAYVSIGNLKIGEKNSYTAKAFNSKGDLLGQATIVIDVESGSSAAPIITIPSENESYDTTLDTVSIGGKVGKWVTRVFINNKEIKDYIPGSEKFSTTIKLEEGENSFTIRAEKSGESVGEDVIQINYQP